MSALKIKMSFLSNEKDYKIKIPFRGFYVSLAVICPKFGFETLGFHREIQGTGLSVFPGPAVTTRASVRTQASETRTGYGSSGQTDEPIWTDRRLWP